MTIKTHSFIKAPFKAMLTALLATLICAPAQAQSAPLEATPSQLTSSELEWERRNWTLVAARGFGKQNGTRTPGETLSVKGTNGPGDIAFNCMVGRVMVAISLDDTPAEDALMGSWNKAKVRGTSVVVKVNGEVQRLGKWIYQGKTKIIFPRERSAGRHFYNYIVRKDKVEVNVKGKTYQLALPPVNMEFNNWGAGCDIGLLAKK